MIKRYIDRYMNAPRQREKGGRKSKRVREVYGNRELEKEKDRRTERDGESKRERHTENER